jgi:hypothetical protein
MAAKNINRVGRGIRQCALVIRTKQMTSPGVAVKRTSPSFVRHESTPRLGARLTTRRGESGMQARVGDRIVIRSLRLGQPDRDCEVVEVRGPDGEPPYMVRWADSDHETLYFPGPDASVQHREHPSSKSKPSGSAKKALKRN